MKKIIKIINQNKDSQSELARKTGISHVAIYNIRTGKSKDISLSTAFKLADVLGVDINEFREDGEDESVN